MVKFRNLSLFVRRVGFHPVSELQPLLPLFYPGIRAPIGVEQALNVEVVEY